jgi:hypothetical protein
MFLVGNAVQLLKEFNHEYRQISDANKHYTSWDVIRIVLSLL